MALPPVGEPLGTAIVTDKGLSCEDTEAFFVGPDLDLTPDPAGPQDEKQPRYFRTCCAKGSRPSSGH